MITRIKSGPGRLTVIIKRFKQEALRIILLIFIILFSAITSGEAFAQNVDEQKGRKVRLNWRKSRTDSSGYNNNHILFLLDVSNSMGRDNKMSLLKRSMEELLKALSPKDAISLLSFGNSVETLYSTTSYKSPDSLLRVISRVRNTASATNINGGIYQSYETLFALRSRNKHLLLITDGEFELNGYTKELVEKNRDKVRITCVIVGKGLQADKAVTYVREELKLPVITLVEEEKDVRNLLKILEYQ